MIGDAFHADKLAKLYELFSTDEDIWGSELLDEPVRQRLIDEAHYIEMNYPRAVELAMAKIGLTKSPVPADTVKSE
jgi:hypothetical protein